MRSWRTAPATAWEHPLVEWARTATSYCSLVLDCDSRESQVGILTEQYAHITEDYKKLAALLAQV